MGAFLKKLVFFICFVSLSYILLLILVGMLLPGGLRKNLLYTFGGNGFANLRLTQAETTGKVDLLFIGSSKAYRGFDAKFFEEEGYRCFNLGSSNQTPVQSLTLLKKYFHRMKPSMVIMEVNPDICSNDGVESAIDLISNSHHYGDMVRYAIANPETRVINTLVFAFAAKAAGIQSRFARPPVGQKYISGGFVESDNVTYRPEEGNDYYCNLNKKQILALEQIAEMITNEGSKLWFVQAPVVPELYTRCNQNIQFDSIVSQISAYENFNLSGKFKVPDHYADGQHLNKSGVMLLAQLASQKIKAMIR